MNVERLHAGPIVKAGSAIVIPVSRITSVLGTRFGAVAVMPVAVVAIAGSDVRAWRIDGQRQSLQHLLDTVPDLAKLLRRHAQV